MQQQACVCRLLAHTCMALLLLSCVQVPRCPPILRVASAAKAQLVRPGTMTGGPCNSAERRSTSALQDGAPQVPEQEASCQVRYCSRVDVFSHLYNKAAHRQQALIAPAARHCCPGMACFRAWAVRHCCLQQCEHGMFTSCDNTVACLCRPKARWAPAHCCHTTTVARR